MGSYAGYIVQTVVTLLAVCALAFVVLYGARRLGVGRPRGPIELVGLLPLDARRAIYLVKVAGRVIVVGASEAGFTKLGELPAVDVPAEQAPDGGAFSDVLARVLGRASGDAVAAKGPRVSGAATSGDAVAAEGPRASGAATSGDAVAAEGPREAAKNGGLGGPGDRAEGRAAQAASEGDA